MEKLEMQTMEQLETQNISTLAIIYRIQVLEKEEDRLYRKLERNPNNKRLEGKWERINEQLNEYDDYLTFIKGMRKER